MVLSVHTLDLNNPKVLIWLEQANGAKGKNVIIGELRSNVVDDNFPVRILVMDKSPDGKESLKITISAPKLGGKESSTSDASRPAVQARLVIQVPFTGHTEPNNRSDRSSDRP